MKKITQEELNKFIENHQHWLNKDCEGLEEMKLNLCGTDLRRLDLSGTDLRWADLRDADLREADLRDADLSGANLSGANLSGAILNGADLSYADLSYADLSYAILNGANLNGADFRWANLNGADFRGASLSWVDFRDAILNGVDFRGASLNGVDFRGASLNGATLREAKNIPYIPMICPEEGSFICFKKANNKIVKLEVPDDAKRSSATTRKCRCSKAKVLGIYDLNHNLLDIECVKSDRRNLIYEVGKMVYPDAFDEDRWNECSNGIHFFMNFQEAFEY